MSKTKIFYRLFIMGLLLTISSCEEKEDFYVKKLTKNNTKSCVTFAETTVQSVYSDGWELGPDRIGVWMTGKLHIWGEYDFSKIKVKPNKIKKEITYTLPPIDIKSRYDASGAHPVYKSVNWVLRGWLDFSTKTNFENHDNAYKSMENDYTKDKGKYTKNINESLEKNAQINAQRYLQSFTRQLKKDENIKVNVKFTH